MSMQHVDERLDLTICRVHCAFGRTISIQERMPQEDHRKHRMTGRLLST